MAEARNATGRVLYAHSFSAGEFEWCSAQKIMQVGEFYSRAVEGTEWAPVGRSIDYAHWFRSTSSSERDAERGALLRRRNFISDLQMQMRRRKLAPTGSRLLRSTTTMGAATRRCRS